MAYVTYTARRSLMAGHTAGAVYTLEFDPAAADKKRKRVTDDQVSLGGVRETLLHRIEYPRSTGADAVHHNNLPQWEEFFDSVAAGESFTLDMYGTMAAPVQPVMVTLDGDGEISRVDGSQYYNIRFTGVA